ncbi:taurine dioxygenase [Cupriavidus sp. SK-4]|uniref:TauD/TfdA dioxygenase family protein n=1 Tax=Cupriavidus sp. SK-4 TaxID=574750 RepID=UPI0004533887|nr:TauD/TfdA family dioxygenase [Cupriavidus sp. SK-4]EYS87460.1 taurine dioxygenase [Cupriavidus sp. SK-4]
MAMQVLPQDAPCGALIKGLDLRQALTDAQVAEIRQHWLAHKVIAFPDQELAVEDIERFAATIGPLGSDPYFTAIPGHPHVAQVRRDAAERTPIFAETWHSDWSFLAQPPAATVLYGNVIPPVGGDTLFADQYAAWDALPTELKSLVADKQGIHSARRGYSRQGAYGEKDKGRSMAIRYSDSALATQLHPIARKHPETGRTALFVSMGYTIGIDGMSDEEAAPVLRALFDHQAQPEFVYRHRWSQGMLMVWDNRCVNHAATGGYDGHDRLLHRITVEDWSASTCSRD